MGDNNTAQKIYERGTQAISGANNIRDLEWALLILASEKLPITA